MYRLISQKGVPGLGSAAAQALIKCGFGDQLIQTWEHSHTKPPNFKDWRAALQSEIHTNSMGHLLHALPKVNLPADFPNRTILGYYLEPKVSVLGSGAGGLRDRGNLDLGRLATLCEKKFDDWGFRERIVKRFCGDNGNIWHPAVTNVLRRAALKACVLLTSSHLLVAMNRRTTKRERSAGHLETETSQFKGHYAHRPTRQWAHHHPSLVAAWVPRVQELRIIETSSLTKGRVVINLSRHLLPSKIVSR